MGLRRTSVRVILAFTVFLVFSSRPFYEAPASDQGVWGVDQLMLGLGQIKSYKARFVEIKYMHILTAPLESSGILFYVAPDRLEQNTLKPRRKTLVVKGNVLTLQRQGHGDQSFILNDYPQIRTYVEGIRATFRGDLKTLKHLYILRLKGKSVRWQLRLVPKDPKDRAMIVSIRISGSVYRIDSIELREKNGDRTVIRILKAGT